MWFWSNLFTSREKLLLAEGDVKDGEALAFKLRKREDPISAKLAERFSDDTNLMLKNFTGERELPSLLVPGLVSEINRQIERESLYSEALFADVGIEAATLRAIARAKSGKNLLRANRTLLLHYFSDELSQKRASRVLCEVVYLAQRRGWPAIEFKGLSLFNYAEGSKIVQQKKAITIAIEGSRTSWLKWRDGPYSGYASKLLTIMKREAFLEALRTGRLGELEGRGVGLYDLCGYDLSGLDLRKFHFGNSQPQFIEANLSDTIPPDDGDFMGANLYRANLKEVKWIQRFCFGANLTDANLYSADLRGANLSEANLSGADLSKAKLVGGFVIGYGFLPDTNLKGAKYSKDTRWPSGFDPRRAGAILNSSESQKGPVRCRFCGANLEVGATRCPICAGDARI